MPALVQKNITATETVAKALINIKQDFSLSNEILGKIIGMDSSTVSRLIQRRNMKDNKVMEAGLLFIRVYRSLYALLGGDNKAMKHWLVTGNNHLQGKPIELLQRIDGLVNVATYLDAMRGKA